MTDDAPKPKRSRFAWMGEKASRVSGWNAIKEGRDATESFFKTAFSDPNIPGSNKNRAFRESFEESVSRQNLSTHDLAEAARVQRLTCLSFLSLAGLTGAFALYMFLFGATLPVHFYGICAFAVTALFGANAFRSAFRHWQIRTRQLGGYTEFKLHPEWWWPDDGSTRPRPKKPDSGRIGTGGTGGTGGRQVTRPAEAKAPRKP